MLRACVNLKLQMLATLLVQMPSSAVASAQHRPNTHTISTKRIMFANMLCRSALLVPVLLQLVTQIKADEQLCSDAGIPQSGCSCKHNVNTPNSRCCNDNRASCSCPTGSNSKWKYIGQCVFHGQPGCQETDTTTTCNNVS